MLEWIKYIGSALAILKAIRPVIDLFISDAETPGHGAEKKKAVLKAIKDTLTELKVDLAVQRIVLAIANGLIEVLVMVLNITNLFKHGEDE